MQKKLQLVLGAVIYTAIGKAKNVGQTFINADTKSILKNSNLNKLGRGGFRSGIGILLAHLPGRKTFKSVNSQRIVKVLYTIIQPILKLSIY